MNRRSLIKGSVIAGISLPLLDYKHLWAKDDGPYEKLVILHTNDTHSRIDPFDSGKYKGLGGVSARKTLIDQIRREEPNVLLLDAGDFFQGTPYFNMYNGELEIKAMSYLGYDAATVGNHDFDNGAENLAKQIEHAFFPLVVSNYDVTDSPLSNKVAPYTVITKGKLKVGIFGLGVELDGLVNATNYEGIIYKNPIEVANRYSNILKHDEDCDIVICLSHLGYDYENKSKVGDIELANKVDNLDIIIGGHSHTFLDCPTVIQKDEKKFVIVNQVGWGGITLGKLDIYFDRNSKAIEKNISNMLKCQNS